MDRLFAPAEAIIGRLSYTGKIFLLVVIFAIPVGFLWWQQFSLIQDDIQDAARERQGLEYLGRAIAVYEAIPRHRGLSQAVLNGDQKARGRLDATAQEVDAALQRLTADDAQDAFKTRKHAQMIADQWRRLQAEGDTLSPAESFERHTALIDEVHRLITHFADQAGLSVDEDITLSLLSRAVVEDLLMSAEYAGRMRGIATGLAAGAFDMQAFARLRSLSDALEGRLSDLRFRMEHALDDDPGIAARLNPPLKQADTALQGFVDYIRDKALGSSQVRLATDEVFDKGTAAIGAAMKLADETEAVLADQLQTRSASLARREALSIGVALGALLAIAYLGSGFYRTVTRSVANLAETTGRLAEGHLDARVEIPTRDELRQVQDAVNHMAEAVGELIGDVLQAGETVGRESEHIAQVTGRTREAMTHQQMQVSQVATAINEMAATVQEVARGANQTAQATGEARELVCDGRRIIDSNVEAIDSLAKEVEHAASVVGGVESDSVEIGTVLEVIRSIAEQTNLLALNAAIEAARAGEQGRGFAVVADEVRTLAARTQQSTEEIQNMIERLQNGTRQAVEVMQSSREKASVGVEKAHQTNEALVSISNAIERIAEMSSQIATAAEEQSVATEQINQSMVQISESADTTLQLSEEADNASRVVAEHARRLQEASARFHLG